MTETQINDIDHDAACEWHNSQPKSAMLEWATAHGLDIGQSRGELAADWNSRVIDAYAAALARGRATNTKGYTTYSRDESGIVTRTHNIVTLTDAEREAEYPHAETLMGWAEVQVFWSRETGPAVGVAPR